MGNPTGDQLVDLGLRLPDLIAGFCGGIVSALAMRQTSILQIFTSVIVGGLTANYLGVPAATYVGFGNTGAPSFIVGLGGMAICQGLIEAIKKWRPSSGGQNGTPTGN